MHPLPVMNAFRTKAYFSSETVVEKVENKWLRCCSNYWGQGGRKITRLSPAWAAEFKASLKIKKNLGMVAHIFHSNIHE